MTLCIMREIDCPCCLIAWCLIWDCVFYSTQYSKHTKIQNTKTETLKSGYPVGSKSIGNVQKESGMRFRSKQRIQSEKNVFFFGILLLELLNQLFSAVIFTVSGSDPGSDDIISKNWIMNIIGTSIFNCSHCIEIYQTQKSIANWKSRLKTTMSLLASCRQCMVSSTFLWPF